MQRLRSSQKSIRTTKPVVSIDPKSSPTKIVTPIIVDVKSECEPLEDEDPLSVPALNILNNNIYISPDTDDNHFFDEPEFVNIKNFTLIDADDIRKVSPHVLSTSPTSKHDNKFSNAGHSNASHSPTQVPRGKKQKKISRALKSLSMPVPKSDIKPVEKLLDTNITTGMNQRVSHSLEPLATPVPKPDIQLDVKLFDTTVPTGMKQERVSYSLKPLATPVPKPNIQLYVKLLDIMKQEEVVKNLEKRRKRRGTLSRYEKKARRQKAARRNETEEERKIRLASQREQKRRSTINQTEEQRERIRQADRIRQRLRRARETAEQRRIRIDKNREKMRAFRSGMDREERQAVEREQKRRWRSNRTEEQLKRFREKDRINKQLKRAQETAKQGRIRTEQDSERTSLSER